MSAPVEPPVLTFAGGAEWEEWLGAHGESSPAGVWLRFAKKGSGRTSLTYGPALDVALCHGWIDGQVRRQDEAWYLQRFTPRRARSIWSKRNVGKAEELIAAGRMRPAGLREVERAKADGRWAAAYDGPARATVPDDLRAALDASPAAAQAFTALGAQNRYAILFRLQTAKRAETRERQIGRFVAMLERGERRHG